MNRLKNYGIMSKPIELFKKIRIPAKILFILTGIFSTVWFLIRVIPKPTRAAYPCMRTAAPWASAFILYLIGLSGSVFSLRKSGYYLKKAKYPVAFLFLILGLIFGIISTVSNKQEIAAATPKIVQAVNDPFGVAQGIYPGRVVWVHNPDATDESCPNTPGHAYFMDTYTYQGEVDLMVAEAVKSLTGETDLIAAWDEVFKYHNQTRGKGAVGYQNSEVIFIKVNATSSWSGNINLSDFSRVSTYPWNPGSANKYYALSETSPHVVLAVLRQLIDTLGIAQNNIYIGDPMKHIYQDNFTKWHSEYPNVHYLDNSSTYSGREVAVETTHPKIFYSDNDTVLDESSDRLYTIFETMEYMINIPTLKAHKHGGVTMFAKNHFGSQSRPDARHLHPGLVMPQDPPVNYRDGYGMYRVLVDIMGHELLGKKNLFYLMDALYTAPHELYLPVKWSMDPFNNDWTSSIFLSFDPVAIESVGYDFLYTEFDDVIPAGVYDRLDTFARFNAVDDYLHQAADPAKWPADIQYDPENDGSNITSLGVHEHWNNAVDKKYSRNLETGDGIELIYLKIEPSLIENIDIVYNKNEILNIYPVPAEDHLYVQVGVNAGNIFSVDILDISGKIVIHKDVKSYNNETIKLEGLDRLNGNLYFIFLKSDKIAKVQSFIKQ